MRKGDDKLENFIPWTDAFEIQKNTVTDFYRRSREILEDSCSLRAFDRSSIKMEKNLFSILFITIFNILPVKKEMIPFYALIVHCMRTLVTGCDNILDNEYKETIPFNLEGRGSKFRSVYMIMTADRIISSLVLEKYREGLIDYNKAYKISSAVMKVLSPSGIEENEEEGNTENRIPSPDEMLDNYLYRKTGKLFESPVNLLIEAGEVTESDVREIVFMLSQFGLGCQLLDEIMDIEEDFLSGGHNMVLSLIAHGNNNLSGMEISDFFSDKSAKDRRIEKIIEKGKKECFSMAAEHFLRAKKIYSALLPGFGNSQALSLYRMIRKIILKDETLINGLLK